jgi:hypothetical protein
MQPAPLQHEREAAMAALGDTPEGRAQRTKMQSDLLIADMSVGLCKLKPVVTHSLKAPGFNPL